MVVMPEVADLVEVELEEAIMVELGINLVEVEVDHFRIMVLGDKVDLVVVEVMVVNGEVEVDPAVHLLIMLVMVENMGVVVGLVVVMVHIILVILVMLEMEEHMVVEAVVEQ